ncbi:MAG: envelope stress response membrane protein PspC [Opitutales bacterium]
MSNRPFTDHRTLYRSREGMIFGVCAGLAEYSQLSTFWVRFAAVVAVFVSGFWPMILIYLVAAIFIKPAPLLAPENVEDWEFYNSYSTNRRMALESLRRKFDGLERRTRRLESIVTSPEYSWDRRFDS